MDVPRPRELRPLFAIMLEEGALTQDEYDALIAVLDRLFPAERKADLARSG